MEKKATCTGHKGTAR